MYSLTLGLAIETKQLWDEVQACLPALPLRPVIEHQDMSSMGSFLERLERLRPEVVLLDVALAKEPLSDLIPMIRAKAPDATIVALHTSADPDAILTAMRAGVNEYVYPPLEGALRGALERRSTTAPLQRNALGRPHCSILSSKGGCGATTIVCHLAVELGKMGQKVLLADLDLDAGLIGFLTKAKPGYSILDAVNNLHRMDVSYWKALVSNGFPGVEIIAAPGATADKTYPRQEQLRQLFSFLRSCYDFTLIDLGRSLTRVGVAALEEMDEAYLVSTLEVPALHQAKQVLQILMDAGYGKVSAEIDPEPSCRSARSWRPAKSKKFWGCPCMQCCRAAIRSCTSAIHWASCCQSGASSGNKSGSWRCAWRARTSRQRLIRRTCLQRSPGDWDCNARRVTNGYHDKRIAIEKRRQGSGLGRPAVLPKIGLPSSARS